MAPTTADLSRAVAGVGQAEGQINSAKASLRQAQSALDRAKQLRSSGSGSQASLDQASTNQETALANVASFTAGLAVAQAQFQQAQAQEDIAQLDLDHVTILAPVDGLIVDRKGRLGAFATSGGDPIFRLIADGHIEVEAEVVETAMTGLRVGNNVLLDIAGIGPVQGELRLISPIVNPVTRLGLGLVRISTEATPGLRGGLFASGWIAITERTSLTGPATAILTDAAGTYVLRVDDKVIARQPVTAGLIWQDQREVLQGLKLDDQVVVKAGAFFADGDTIRPVLADGSEAIQ